METIRSFLAMSGKEFLRKELSAARSLARGVAAVRVEMLITMSSVESGNRYGLQEKKGE